GRQRRHRVDRELHLLEVPVVLRFGREAEATVAERGDRDQRLDQDVLDLEPPELLYELAGQLLFALRHERAPGLPARRPLAWAPRRRAAQSAARPESPPAP